MLVLYSIKFIFNSVAVVYVHNIVYHHFQNISPFQKETVPIKQYVPIPTVFASNKLQLTFSIDIFWIIHIT